MNSLRSESPSVDPNGDALAAINRLLLGRGAYDEQARADVRLEILITGELPTQLIDPEDVAEAEAIWKAAHTMPTPDALATIWQSAHTMPDPAALASGTEAPAPPADGVPVGPPPLAASDLDLDDLDDFRDVPERPARVHRVPLLRVREDLLNMYMQPMRSRQTYRMMKRAFDVLAELNVATSFDLTEGLVAQLIKTRPPGLSCRTVAQYLRCIRVISKFCIHRGWLRESPFAFRPVGAWVRITPVEHHRFYTSDEVRSILTTMQADVDSTDGWPQWKARRLLAVTATCAYGGFRMSECFRLHVSDIDLELGIITVAPRFHLKTPGSARLVPCPPKLKPILEDWLSHRLDAPPNFLTAEAMKCPFAFPNITRTNYWYDGPTGQKPINRLKAVAQRAGVPNATFARFRHAWATQAEFLGVPAAGIQRILGHTTELTSLRNYRHSIAKNLTDTVQSFDY